MSEAPKPNWDERPAGMGHSIIVNGKRVENHPFRVMIGSQRIYKDGPSALLTIGNGVIGDIDKVIEIEIALTASVAREVAARLLEVATRLEDTQ
ncbi:MAG TPA: hypothetical protein VGI39_17205 [Polyangiaceae bacterium]|jgi:UTP-glucose-1-phosphate uridylyltransferase